MDIQKVCYSILHYNNIEVTKACVESIHRVNQGKSYDIIIVDNASPNNSGQVLKELYAGDKYIHVILNKENGGFSSGNNVGYLYAKETLSANIIVVMNSDIIVHDNFNVDTISSEFDRLGCDVLGPDIINPHGNHQNPLRVSDFSFVDCCRNLLMNYSLAIILSIPLIGRKCFEKYKSSTNKRECRLLEQALFDSHNYTPHGSCVIFGGNWVKKENSAFLPLTFLYAEEMILKEYISRKEYALGYSNNLSITHLGEGSINGEFEDMHKKLIGRNLLQCKAIKQYMKYKFFTR